jgi:hypothetical protein
MEITVRSAQSIAWIVHQPIGRPKVITEEYMDTLQQLVEHRPQVYGYPFMRWTAAWLGCHLVKEFGIEVGNRHINRHINRLLQQMGLSTQKGNGRKNDSNSGHYRARRILIQDLNPKAVPEFEWPQNSVKSGIGLHL